MEYLAVFAVGYIVGWWWRGIMVLYNLSRNPKAVIKMLEQLRDIDTAESQKELDSTLAKIKGQLPDATELFIEQVNGQYYAYIKETNKFIGQAPELAQLLENAHKQYPGSKFFGTVEEDNNTKQVAQ